MEKEKKKKEKKKKKKEKIPLCVLDAAAQKGEIGLLKTGNHDLIFNL